MSSPLERIRFLEGYRGAVALGIMGVALLERGAYRDAIRALQDALSVFKLMIDMPPAGISTSPLGDNMSQTISTKLQQTERALAGKHTNQCSKRHMHLKTISQDESFAILKSLLIDEGLCSNFAFLIRIQATSSCPLGADDINFPSIILLHNLGVAYICLAKVTQQSQMACRYNETALKILLMAHTLMVIEQESFCVSNNGLARYISTDCLAVTVVVTKTIINAMASTGRGEQAQMYFARFAELERAVDEMRDRELFIGRATTAGAA